MQVKYIGGLSKRARIFFRDRLTTPDDFETLMAVIITRVVGEWRELFFKEFLEIDH